MSKRKGRRTSATASSDQMAGPRSTQTARALVNAQIKCIQSKARARDTTAIPDLIALAKSGDRRVRVAAVEALGYFRNAQTHEPLLQLLDDPKPEIRKAAVLGLALFNDEGARQALVGRLRDDDHGVQETAASALARMSAAWLFSPAGLSAIESLLSTRRRFDEPTLELIAGLLARMPIGKEQARLRNWVTHANEHVRWVAVLRLADSDAPADVVLAAYAALDASPAVRRVARDRVEVARIRWWEAPEAAQLCPGILGVLDERETDRLKEAIWLAARIRCVDALPRLVRLLEDRRVDHRVMAAEGFGLFQDRSAIKPLARRLVDPDPGVRSAVEQALTKIDPNWSAQLESLDCQDAFRAALYVEQADVHEAASRWLAAISPQIATTAQIDLLDDADAAPTIRRKAAAALERIDDRRADAALLGHYLGDADRDVSERRRRLAEAPASVVRDLREDPNRMVLLGTLRAVAGSDDGVMKSVARLLDDPNPQVHWRAWKLLSELPSSWKAGPEAPAIVLHLVARALGWGKVSLDDVRQALHHLEEIGDPHAIEPLLQHVHDYNRDCKAALEQRLKAGFNAALGPLQDVEKRGRSMRDIVQALLKLASRLPPERLPALDGPDNVTLVRVDWEGPLFDDSQKIDTAELRRLFGAARGPRLPLASDKRFPRGEA